MQIDSNRILLAADTRGNKLDPGARTINEGECKIVPLSNAAFAVTGNMDYIRNQPNDPMASWDSRADARAAAAAHNDDPVTTAEDWSSRAKRHFLSFYRANPMRVAELAKANTQNMLLAGMFVGFRKGKGMLVVQLVYLDERQTMPILDKQILLSGRDAPYTSNGITQELIEGHSERTRTAEAEWQKRSAAVPPSSKAYDRMEFLIQETSKYDKSVGMRVNILELFPDRKPEWVQNFTCPQNSRGSR